MKRKLLPKTRTIRALQAAGHLAGDVERTIPHTKIRQDLFGFIDIVAIHGSKVMGIQATDYTSHAKHRTKAARNPSLKRWLRAGAGFEIWSWRPVPEFRQDGTRKPDCVMEELYLSETGRLLSFGIVKVNHNGKQ